MKWEMVKIGDITKVTSGFAFKSKLFNDSEGIPIIRIRDVNRGFSTTFYSGNYSDDYLIKKGDMLISMDGEFRVKKWKSKKALLNQRVCKIESSSVEISNEYLYYFLPKKLQEIEAVTSFVTVKHLSVKKIKNIQIPLPPLTEQKRIAQLLDTADALRQKDKALLAGYDELLESVFLEMFGDVGGNPNGWKTNLLNDLVEIQSGLIDPRKLPYSNMPHIGGNNIESNTGDFLDLRPAHELNLISGKYYFDQEYILYNKIRPYLNKVAMPNFEGICSADMYPIKPKNTTNKYYIFKVLTSDFFLSFAGKHSRRASIPKINRKDLLSFNVPTPPISLQNKFAEIVQNIEAQKDKVRLQLKESEDLFGALMQEVFG